MLHTPRQAFAPFLAYEEAPISALSPIERQVIYLSLADDRRSTIAETRIHRLWRALFASRNANRLADPRLEALRVFCVLYRYDRSIIKQRMRVSGTTKHFLELATMAAAAELIDHVLPDRP